MISRRRFVHGFAGAAFVLGAARWNSTSGAETRPGAVLSGTQFDLTSANRVERRCGSMSATTCC
jgi:hypothetical protein